MFSFHKICSLRLTGRGIVTVLALAAMSAILVIEAEAEDGTYFIKASKSVPRIGRRGGDYDNFFVKATKSVPRIGRRGNAGAPDILDETREWDLVPVPAAYRMESSDSRGPGYESLDKRMGDWNSLDLGEQYEVQRMRRETQQQNLDHE